MSFIRAPLINLCSSLIVSSISERCKNSDNSVYAYFFFDGRSLNQKVQGLDGLTRSLIRQLASKRQGLAVPIIELYNACNKGHSQPSVPALQEALSCLLEGYRHVYIVIDSVDECVPAERSALLHWIGELRSSHAGRLHILIAGRPLNDIKDLIMRLVPTDISLTEESHDDIKTIVIQRLQGDDRLSQWDPTTKEHIKTALLENAQGMCVPFVYQSSSRSLISSSGGSDGWYCNWTSYVNVPPSKLSRSSLCRCR